VENYPLAYIIRSLIKHVKYDNTILVLRSHIQEVLCMFNGEATDADVGDNATEDVTNDNAAVFRSIRKLDMTVEGFR